MASYFLSICFTDFAQDARFSWFWVTPFGVGETHGIGRAGREAGQEYLFSPWLQFLSSFLGCFTVGFSGYGYYCYYYEDGVMVGVLGVEGRGGIHLLGISQR